MIQKSTHYFFQYTHFDGKELIFFDNSELLFDVDCWLKQEIEKLIALSPEVPDELIQKILKKANVC